VIGTLATVAVSVLRGAHIVRVHDVPPIRQTAAMVDAIINPEGQGA
jgi:dihydropteroate synthase